MYRLTTLALALCLVAWPLGCKIEKAGSSRLADAGDEWTAESPGDAGASGSEEYEEESSDEETSEAGESVPTEEEAVEGQENATDAAEAETGQETTDVTAEVAEEPTPAETPETEVLTAEPEESVAEAPAAEAELAHPGPAKPRTLETPSGTTAPTPGIELLALSANAEVLDAHLRRCEKFIQGAKYESAKRSLASAQRALSFADAQRPAAILGQALDRLSAHVEEKDALGARRALRLADEQIEDTELGGTLAETIEHLADALKSKDFVEAADTLGELQRELQGDSDRDGRLLDTVRAGLVQANLSLLRHAPAVALAEVKEARVHVQKLVAGQDEE